MSKQEIYEGLLNDLKVMYAKKNSDYGDSVGDTYKKFGDVSFLTRITDKYNRLVSVTAKGNTEVKDETIEDTIADLANYCLLWLTERVNAKLEDRQEPNRREIEVKPKLPPSSNKATSQILVDRINAQLKIISNDKMQKLISILDSIGANYHIETQCANEGKVKAILVIDKLSTLSRALEILKEVE